MGSGAAFPTDGQSFELLEQGEGLFHHVPELARALDVRGALAGDSRQDAALVELFAVRVGIVALVAEQGFGTAARTAGTADDGRMLEPKPSSEPGSCRAISLWRT